MLAVILSSIVVAFIVGALARFAVPGPDPMPPWLTVAIGLVSTTIGSSIVWAVEGRHEASRDTGWVFTASFFVGIGIVVAYRVFWQKRPLLGPDAYRFPEKGIGVEHQRERLRKAGIDPDKIGAGNPFGMVDPGGVATPRPAAPVDEYPGEPTENPAHYLGLLEELHDSGVLDDSEFEAARTRLLEKLR